MSLSLNLRHVCFNHEQDCFAVATDDGVRVFNCDPLTELTRLKVEEVGSVRLVAILNRTNLIAIVSGEPRPRFSNKTVMLWDNAKRKFAFEVTVNGPVLNILLSSTRLIVVQHRQVHVFALKNSLELVKSEETGVNPTGLAVLSPDPKMEFLVYPGFKNGSIQLVNLQNASQSRSLAPTTIEAHDSTVVKIALNNQATRVATGSQKGTIIRIFDTRTKQQMFELRRGVDFATLHCLRFSHDSVYLAVSSDKGTIHVFDLVDNDDDRGLNMKKIWDQMRFCKDEKRSIVQYSLPNPEQVAECAFIDSSITSGFDDAISCTKDVISICTDGTYYRYSRNKAEPQGYELIFNLASDQDFWVV